MPLGLLLCIVASAKRRSPEHAVFSFQFSQPSLFVPLGSTEGIAYDRSATPNFLCYKIKRSIKAARFEILFASAITADHCMLLRYNESCTSKPSYVSWSNLEICWKPLVLRTLLVHSPPQEGSPRTLNYNGSFLQPIIPPPHHVPPMYSLSPTKWLSTKFSRTVTQVSHKRIWSPFNRI